MHPAAKMLVDLANAQDIEAGDGTTTVVVIAGSLLGAAERLLGKGGHFLMEDTTSRTKGTDGTRHTSNRYIRIISACFSCSNQDSS